MSGAKPGAGSAAAGAPRPAPRIGILGGAFDPPHNGHVALAQEAVEHFGLEQLLVRVVAAPGHKDVETAAAVRLLLAELAFGQLAGAEVSLDPFARTADSLEALAADDPRVQPDERIFLIGADELAAFGSWERPERVLELARVGAATRPGVDAAELASVIRSLSHPERVELFAITALTVSSSEVRERVARGESIDELVPEPVAAEIRRLGLYRTS